MLQGSVVLAWLVVLSAATLATLRKERVSLGFAWCAFIGFSVAAIDSWLELMLAGRASETQLLASTVVSCCSSASAVFALRWIKRSGTPDASTPRGI